MAVLLVAAAIALAACSGGSRSPHVASLPAATGAGKSLGTDTRSGGGSSATTAPQPNPTQLLDEWASCMQRHGDPNQADPTIDANKIIHITWNPAVPGGTDGTNKGGQGNSGPGQYCRSYLNGAQNALQGGTVKMPSQATLLKFSECMQAHGIHDFPDPKGDSLAIPVNGGGDLNLTNPTFQNASTECARKTGVRGFGSGPGPGGIELNGGGLPGGGG